MIRMLGLCIFLTLHGFAGAAQEVLPSPSYPDFEAKRIRPPSVGTARRITVQIDPSPADTQGAGAAVGVAAGTDADAAQNAEQAESGASQYDWFWEAVGDDLAGASPGRLETAMAVLEQQTSVPVPRLQNLQDMIGAYGVALLTSTIGTDVSPALALAVMSVESAGDPDAVSGAGAQGLMQLIPATADRFGVQDVFDPQDNIAGGVRFLDELMDEFSADPVLVLGAYNAGAGAVRDNAGVPPFVQTRDYVPKVLAAYRVIRSLCQTPPIMITDGCVFRNMN